MSVESAKSRDQKQNDLKIAKDELLWKTQQLIPSAFMHNSVQRIP